VQHPDDEVEHIEVLDHKIIKNDLQSEVNMYQVHMETDQTQLLMNFDFGTVQLHQEK